MKANLGNLPALITQVTLLFNPEEAYKRKGKQERKKRPPEKQYPDKFHKIFKTITGYRWPILSNKVASLPVVRPLILQPLSVSLDTTNLLAVVIGNRVRHGVGRRIHAESLYSIVEFLFFL